MSGLVVCWYRIESTTSLHIPWMPYSSLCRISNFVCLSSLFFQMMRRQSTSNPRIGRDPVSFLSMGNYPTHVIKSAISKAVVHSSFAHRDLSDRRGLLDLFRHLALGVIIVVVNKGPSGTSRHRRMSHVCLIMLKLSSWWSTKDH